jgi:hypothetical protein
MQRQAVSSSTIAEIGYDEPRRILEIQFRNGTTYQYFDISPQEHQGLMAAGSQGQYLNANIKGKYRYARV